MIYSLSYSTLANNFSFSYNISRNHPGSFGERARSRSERIGSCFFMLESFLEEETLVLDINFSQTVEDGDEKQ